MRRVPSESRAATRQGGDGIDALWEVEERKDYLERLGDALRALKDPAEIQLEAARVLGEQIGAAWACYAECGDSPTVARVLRAHVLRDLPSMVGLHPLGEFPDLLAILRSGRSVAIENLQDWPLISPRAAAKFAAAGVRAGVCAPVVKAGALLALVCAADLRPRVWTRAEVLLIEETAERTWTTVERARAERELRASEERLRLALEASGMGTFVWHPGTDRGEPDARMRTLFGVPHNGQLSMAAAIEQLVHPDDRARYAAAVARAIDPSGAGKLREDIRVFHPDGAQRWLSVFGHTEFVGQPPQPVRMVGMAVDVTDRKRDEQALKVSEARQAFLLGLGDALRSRHDPHDIQEEATRVLRQYLGATRACYIELEEDGNRLAVTRDDHVPGAARARCNYELDDFGPTLMAALRTGGTLVVGDVHAESVLTPVERATYAVVGVRAYCDVPLIKEGRLLSVLSVQHAEPRSWTTDEIAVVEETAERTWAAVARARAESAQRRAHEEAVRLREAANEANRAKDEFLALLGHELRNPLTPILAVIELMKRQGVSAFARERRVIERQARHLARLVDDLLDVTRIVRGKVKLVRERVDIGQVVARAVEIVSPVLEEKRHRLLTELDAGLWVEGDQDRLVQVISNLLSNAAKYTEAGGCIQIGGRVEKGSVVVRVRDDGGGIDRELLPRVFDLFRQGAQTSDRKEGGLGLGLAIVRNLVELHGGAVAAASDGPGTGSELTVRLPIARPRRSRSPKLPTRSPRRAALKGQRILIVDDNRDIADLLARLLRKDGHAVKVAYGADAGLRHAKTFRPRLALLDIGLPEMDGYELARRLAAERGLAGIRLVALTGYGQAADRRRALKAGFSDHIVKPLDFDQLARVIEGTRVVPTA
jgi:PAS domain S-box-containing protein